MAHKVSAAHDQKIESAAAPAAWAPRRSQASSDEYATVSGNSSELASSADLRQCRCLRSNLSKCMVLLAIEGQEPCQHHTAATAESTAVHTAVPCQPLQLKHGHPLFILARQARRRGARRLAQERLHRHLLPPPECPQLALILSVSLYIWQCAHLPVCQNRRVLPDKAGQQPGL